ncbi:retinoblastoma-like protein 2 isoform X2 [Gasterosteus aculeatus]
MATGLQGEHGWPRFGPRDRLIAMFSSCSRNPTKAIEKRLRDLLHTFLQHFRDNAGNENRNDLAEKCCCEAGVWYYRILENVISQERNRNRIGDITVICQNEHLQCCLAACCLEITTSSNCLPCDFPLLLQILKLTPYDFLMTIEVVLRAEPDLPGAAFRHLAQVEEKILECSAWTSDSPLWGKIQANESALPACQQALLPTQLEDPRRTDFHPDRNHPGGAEPSVSTEPQRSPSAVNGPHRSNFLHLFARKVYSLMGQRLRKLCSLLDISDELRVKIWTVFERSLIHWADLMMDRHLDQFLMCAIYITAKVTKMEITFKRIMRCYKSQPLVNRRVCNNVLISGRDGEVHLTGTNDQVDNGVGMPTPDSPSTHHPGAFQEERGNLIDFYNQIYWTRMEHFAKQFAPTSGEDTPPLSPFPRQRQASPRRRRLSNNPQIYVSLLNTDTTSPITPGLSYFINSSPPECLREINNMLRTGRSPSTSRRCFREEEEEEEEEDEDGPSVKRPRLDGQSAWQRRLRNVVNDRVTTKDRDPDRD